jgi:S-adenosylmethionine:tRNA ribosyltransferase-isomerase
MKIEKELTIEDFEYDLPEGLIAQEPASKKDHSRLLVVDRAGGALAHKHFYDLPDILQSGDVLVVNDTKVLPSRLICRRHSGGTIKLLLLKPLSTNTAHWEALVTPIKRLKVDEVVDVIVGDSETPSGYKIRIADFSVGPDGFKRVIVDLGAKENVYNLLSQVGFAPLPPYIHRDYRQEEESGHRKEDLLQYQTVFASAPGAVAAPTAGLHFTEKVLSDLKAKNIEVVKVTLHVGAGTFKPIEDSLENHTIEAEEYTVSEETAEAINKAKAEGRRIIAVGTTSLRTIESAGASGKMIAAKDASTNLYIKVGHKFQIADAMLTNFHLSRSSLLVLVAAFAGHKTIMDAYKEAIAEKYRFYSYGDAMLIL